MIIRNSKSKRPSKVGDRFIETYYDIQGYTTYIIFEVTGSFKSFVNYKVLYEFNQYETCPKEYKDLPIYIPKIPLPVFEE
jgi:hypothetical protein